MRDLEHLRRRYADHVPGLLGARHSYAVLCPLVERPDGLHLLFEVRSAALHRQPGEVCFPGGRMEAGETPEQCALRETEEESEVIPNQRSRPSTIRARATTSGTPCSTSSRTATPTPSP